MAPHINIDDTPEALATHGDECYIAPNRTSFLCYLWLATHGDECYIAPAQAQRLQPNALATHGDECYIAPQSVQPRYLCWLATHGDECYIAPDVRIGFQERLVCQHNRTENYVDRTVCRCVEKSTHPQ